MWTISGIEVAPVAGTVVRPDVNYEMRRTFVITLLRGLPSMIASGGCPTGHTSAARVGSTDNRD
jgi:hypothetical protein